MLYRYAGPCSKPKLTQAAAEVRQAVSKMEAALQRHLFASFIELFQNVDRYGVSHDEGDAERPYGEISITRTKTGSSQIHAANLIPASARDQLEATLSELQGLDRASLSELYHEQLPKPCVKDAPSGAAGLGLIELAKRCQSQLSFSFQPVHESC